MFKNSILIWSNIVSNKYFWEYDILSQIYPYIQLFKYKLLSYLNF